MLRMDGMCKLRKSLNESCVVKQRVDVLSHEYVYSNVKR